jgi:tetratricopeptide (TPR) repeat protein
VVVSGVVLLVLIGIGPAAWFASANSALPPQTEPQPAAAPDRTMPLGLRTVPVYRADGVVPRAFGTGDRLPSQAQLDSAIDAAARSLSITQMPRIRTVLGRTFTDGIRNNTRYPFAYPRLDPLVAEALPVPLMRSRAAEINDLAVLLILQGAHRRDAVDATHDMAAAAAYAILNRLRQTVPSCDVQLNLAFLVASDTDGWRAETRTEFERAAELCDDPTPLWLLGQYQIARACSLCSLSEAERAEQLDLAADTFARLQREHPDVPLGLAGQADVLLRRAEDAQSRRIRPFEARRQFSEAADLYRRVVARSDDPGLAAGLARAEAGSAHLDEATALLDASLAAVPRDPVLQTLSVELDEHAGRFGDAARALASLPPPDLPDNTSLIFEPASLIGWPMITTRVGGVAAAPVQLYVTDPPGQGDASVLNYWVIPDFRSAEETMIDGWCRKTAAIRDLLLSGQQQAANAMANDPRPGDEYVAGRWCFSPLLPQPPHDRRPAVLYAIAAAEAGDSTARDRWLQEAYGATDAVRQGLLYERRQNLLRFGRDLDQAGAVIEEWIAAIPDDPLAFDMRGEVAFLRGDFAAAEAAFNQAADRYRTRLGSAGLNDFSGAESLPTRYYLARAQLKLALTQVRAGDRNRALATYQGAIDLTSELAVAALQGATDDHLIQTRYHALAQRGDLLLADRRFDEAVRSYDEAISLSNAVHQLTPGGEALLTGAPENNRALALLRSGRAADSVASARQALARDPDNPIFLEAYASALRETGDTAAAITAYRRAMAVDPTLFTAQNNLGVLLARTGQLEEAELAFRRSVGANPDYALGWANLGGVLGARRPLLGFLEAQGAWLRAASLQPDLRGTRPGPTLDEAVYASNLDLSRPLPPDWQFTSSSRPPVTGFGVLMVLTLIWRVGVGLGLDQVVDGIAGRVVTARPPDRPRWRLLGARLHPAIAFAASVLIIMIASVGTFWSAGIAATILEIGLVGLGAAAVLAAFLSVRRTASAPAGERRHFSSPPAVGLGLGLSLVQVPFVPAPCLGPAPDNDERPRWRGIFVLMGIAAGLCAVAAALPAPVLRALAVASVAMTASALVPVRPFDGGYVRRRTIQWLITAALAAATVIIELHWI